MSTERKFRKSRKSANCYLLQNTEQFPCEQFWELLNLAISIALVWLSDKMIHKESQSAKIRGKRDIAYLVPLYRIETLFKQKPSKNTNRSTAFDYFWASCCISLDTVQKQSGYWNQNYGKTGGIGKLAKFLPTSKHKTPAVLEYQTYEKFLQKNCTILERITVNCHPKTDV